MDIETFFWVLRNGPLRRARQISNRLDGWSPLGILLVENVTSRLRARHDVLFIISKTACFEFGVDFPGPERLGHDHFS
jgi:hypothetical protein